MSRNVVGWFRGRLGRFQKSDVDGELGRKSICLSWDEHEEKAFAHKA